jgi:hypothetical protein
MWFRNSESGKDATVPGVLFVQEKRRRAAESLIKTAAPPESTKEGKKRRGTAEKPNKNHGPPEGTKERKEDRGRV